MREELEKDMTPKLIGETYMKYPTDNSTKKSRYGIYECPYCGEHWETMVKIIMSPNFRSCGCTRANTVHGLRSHKFYRTWYNMLDRCINQFNKGYKNYGGRGITVCEEWLDIKNFVAWVEETHPGMAGLSLDRIDNDKGYSPENCRWADRITQSINQRMKSTNTSGFTGVYWNTYKLSWSGSINVEKKRIWLGTFKTLEEAVLARDNYIIENNLPHKLSTDYVEETK